MPHQEPSPLRSALWIALFGVVLTLAVQAVEPFFFLRDDNSTYYLPTYVHSFRSLIGSGELAQVNPHQYLGIPHLASGQPAVLYPPTYLAILAARALGDLRWAIDLLVALHSVMAGVGMLLLLRRLGSGRHGGDVAGALLWQTAPFVVLLSRAWLPFAYSAAFLPWSLWLLMRLLDRPGWRAALAYGSAKTFFFFAGYPQILVSSSLFEGLFWLGMRGPKLLESGTGSLGVTLRQARAIGGAAAWTVATSAPLLLPMSETLSVSFMRRRPLPLDVFAEFPLQLGDFVRAQIFDFRSDVFITSTSSIYYLGLPMILAYSAFWLRDRRTLRPVTVLASLALVALAASTSAWKLLYGAPLLSDFRWPAKNFLFVVFAVIPPACLVFERVARRRRRWAMAALLVSLAGSLSILVVPEWRRTMGEATLERPIAEYERHLAAACDDGEVAATEPRPGRVASLRKDGTLTAAAWDELAPYLSAYHYATLFRRYHLGGYEPLVSGTHHALSAGMSYTATLPLRQVDERLVRHLAHWGVGCVLVPELPGVREHLSAVPGLRWARTVDGIASYRLDASPIAGWVGRPGAGRRDADHRQGDLAAEVPVHWTPNGLEAATSGPGGILRLAVAPLDAWTVRVDGQETRPVRIDPRAGVLVSVPPGPHRVRLAYRDWRFELGLWIAVSSVVLVLLLRLCIDLAGRFGDASR